MARFFMKRRTIIILILLALFMAACGDDSSNEGEAFTPPDVPALTLQDGQNTTQGLITQLCWPEGVGNLSCDPTFGETQPTDSLAVTATDEITIGVGADLVPSQLVVTVRGPSGNVAAEETIAGPDISNTRLAVSNWGAGRNLVEVTAYYQGVEGTDPVVSSVFAVQVGAGVAVENTPTTQPSATSTTAPTVTATTEPPTATATETVVSTETPPIITTTEPATIAETPTVSGTTTTAPSPTSDTVTVPDVTETVDGETPTVTSTSDDTLPRVTNTPTEAPSETATDRPTPTPTERPSNTPQPPTATMTATVTLTEAPMFGETATNTPFGFEPSATPSTTPTTPPPSPTMTPTTPPPTPTLTPTTPPPTNTPFISATPPTNDVRGFLGEAPKAQLTSMGREYFPAGIEFCRWNQFNEQICIERAADTFSARMRIRRGNAAVFEIEGERPTMVSYELATTPFSPLVSEVRPGDNVILFNIDLPAGTYFLTFEVTWLDMRGTYYFRVQVVE